MTEQCRIPDDCPLKDKVDEMTHVVAENSRCLERLTNSLRTVDDLGKEFIEAVRGRVPILLVYLVIVLIFAGQALSVPNSPFSRFIRQVLAMVK